MTLFRNSVLKLGAYWIGVGPNSDDHCPIRRGGHTATNRVDGPVETKADTGLNQWEAKEHKDGQKPPEARTGKEGCLSGGFRGAWSC